MERETERERSVPLCRHTIGPWRDIWHVAQSAVKQWQSSDTETSLWRLWPESKGLMKRIITNLDNDRTPAISHKIFVLYCTISYKIFKLYCTISYEIFKLYCKISYKIVKLYCTISHKIFKLYCTCPVGPTIPQIHISHLYQLPVRLEPNPYMWLCSSVCNFLE